MGCAASREVSGPHNHHHHRRGQNHPSNSYHDWNKKERGYAPYQHQGQHRRHWHQEEDKEAHGRKVRTATERARHRRALKHYDANDEKAQLNAHYREHVRRKRADAYGQQVRDAAERERNREALKYYDVHSKKERLRRPHDEERRRRAAVEKTEEIRVYASPDLKSRWSE